MPEVPRPKVAMIGVDAGELGFIREHLQVLPTFRRLLDTGTLHRLASTAGVFPGSVWPTFYSGTPPGEHGIYHHLQWDPGAMQLRRVADDWLYVEPFWYELERRGLRVAAIDVPMSFPSRLTTGTEVINWGSHDELGPFRAHPGHLAPDIRRLFGRHPMGSEIPVRKSTAQLEKVRRNLVAGAALKAELSRWVLAQGEWDFFLTIFGETHRGGHLLWPEEGAGGLAADDRLLDVYRAVDRSIGQLLEVIQEKATAVVVFALHGMGRNDSQEHLMPSLMDRVNAGFLQAGASNATGDRTSPPAQRSAMRVLRERLPPWLQNAVARAVPVAARDLVVNRQITAGRDWDRTPGIALLADLNGYVRWNLRGRERLGMLEARSERLERYIAWLTDCFTGLRVSGTEAPMVRELLLTRDHFPGSRVGFLPDAVVTWTGLPSAPRIDSPTIGALVAEPATGRAGNHRPDGFCIVVEGMEGQRQGASPPRHISELSTFACTLLGQRSTVSKQGS